MDQLFGLQHRRRTDPMIIAISNVVNVLGIHEFECHGEKRMTSEQHWKILQNQRDHNSWNKATPQLKELYRYLEINKIDNYSRPR